MIPAQSEARISGSYLGSPGRRSLAVGGTSLLGLSDPGLVRGDVVVASGVPTRTGLRVTNLARSLFAADIHRVIADGYLSTPDDDGFYMILGVGGHGQTSMPEMIKEADRAVYCQDFDPDNAPDIVPIGGLGALDPNGGC